MDPLTESEEGWVPIVSADIPPGTLVEAVFESEELIEPDPFPAGYQ